MRIAITFALLATVSIAHADINDKLATTERWGAGLRLTGLSGIGALPGVNYGAEVAVLGRRDEVFAEVALARWKPENDYLVTETQDRVPLKLDVWTLRVGWSSMQMPLRGWGLVELGEMAGARGPQGVVPRMMMGDTPKQRQWRSVGGGFGVAWPMSDQARLFGSLEVTIPTPPAAHARSRRRVHARSARRALHGRPRSRLALTPAQLADATRIRVNERDRGNVQDR
jgi:hypothetical protein